MLLLFKKRSPSNFVPLIIGKQVYSLVVEKKFLQRLLLVIRNWVDTIVIEK